jgi:ribonuclease P protein subunit RPR2
MDNNTKHIAAQRVRTLFSLANQTFKEDPTLAQRYAETARKIAMATKIRLPKEYRRQICKHCKSFIMPGSNMRVRTRKHREPHVTITCLNCGKHMRIQLRKKEMKTHA